MTSKAPETKPEMRAEQNGSPWSKTIGAEFLAELGRRWDCHEPLLAALKLARQFIDGEQIAHAVVSIETPQVGLAAYLDAAISKAEGR